MPLYSPKHNNKVEQSNPTRHKLDAEKKTHISQYATINEPKFVSNTNSLAKKGSNGRPNLWSKKTLETTVNKIYDDHPLVS